MKVGLIGCGRIAFEAHLPAYKKYNVKVVAVCDLIESRAKQAAKEFNIPHYFTDAEELAAYKEVELIDIATRPSDRIDLLRSLYQFQKPMLIQKPLCYSYDEAALITEEFRRNALVGAINHNARWAPVSLQLAEWISQNKLGTLYQIHHTNRFNENLKAWYTDKNEYLFIDHGIHYLDLVRNYAKEMPISVSAICKKKPGQVAQCPLSYSINLQFDSGLLASLYFNNAVPTPYSFACHWFLDGSLGSAHGTIDSVSCYNENGILANQKRLNGDWVPEGFLGSYQALVDALKRQKVPPHSLADHLKTLKIAFAAIASAESNGKWVKICA